MTDHGSFPWLAVHEWVESGVHLSLGLQGWTCLYIYNPELPSPLALLSVSQGLSVCSPSAASSFLRT